MTTDAERAILNHLADAFNLYTKLPVQHPMEQHEFANAIHAAQDIIAVRVARRADPGTWPTA